MMLSTISLTGKLLSFDTINPLGNECDCARYLGGLLEDAAWKIGYYEFAQKRATLIPTLPWSRWEAADPLQRSSRYGSIGRNRLE